MKPLSLESQLTQLEFAKTNNLIRVQPINGCFYGWEVEPKSEELVKSICLKMGGEYNSELGVWQTSFNLFELLNPKSAIYQHYQNRINGEFIQYKPLETCQWLIKSFLPKGLLKYYYPSPMNILITQGGLGEIPWAIASAFNFSFFPKLKLTILEPSKYRALILKQNGFSKVIDQSFLRYKTRQKYDFIFHFPLDSEFDIHFTENHEVIDLKRRTEFHLIFKAFSKLKMNGELLGIIPVAYLTEADPLLQRFHNLIAAHGEITFLPIHLTTQATHRYMAFRLLKAPRHNVPRTEFDEELIEEICERMFEVSQFYGIQDDDIFNSGLIYFSLLIENPIFFPYSYLTNRGLLIKILDRFLFDYLQIDKEVDSEF